MHMPRVDGPGNVTGLSFNERDTRAAASQPQTVSVEGRDVQLCNNGGECEMPISQLFKSSHAGPTSSGAVTVQETGTEGASAARTVDLVSPSEVRKPSGNLEAILAQMQEDIQKKIALLQSWLPGTASTSSSSPPQEVPVSRHGDLSQQVARVAQLVLDTTDELLNSFPDEEDKKYRTALAATQEAASAYQARLEEGHLAEH